MLEITEALARIAAMLRPLGTERIALDEVLGRICAETLMARLTAPPFAVAAMDGYALRWEDSHQVLSCVGVAKAGDPMGAALASGTCLRIFTGAPVPPLADTVVQQERVATDGECVRIGPDAEPFRHIRPAGSNLEANATVIRPGTRLTARDIGLAARKRTFSFAPIPVISWPSCASPEQTSIKPAATTFLCCDTSAGLEGTPKRKIAASSSLGGVQRRRNARPNGAI